MGCDGGSLAGLPGGGGGCGGGGGAGEPSGGWPPPRSCIFHSSIALRSAWLGNTVAESSAMPVTGLVTRLSRNQRRMHPFSYEWPSTQVTGSAMRSPLIGHTNELGGDQTSQSMSMFLHAGGQLDRHASARSRRNLMTRVGRAAVRPRSAHTCTGPWRPQPRCNIRISVQFQSLLTTRDKVERWRRRRSQESSKRTLLLASVEPWASTRSSNADRCDR